MQWTVRAACPACACVSTCCPCLILIGWHTVVGASAREQNQAGRALGLIDACTTHMHAFSQTAHQTQPCVHVCAVSTCRLARAHCQLVLHGTMLEAIQGMAGKVGAPTLQVRVSSTAYCI